MDANDQYRRHFIDMSAYESVIRPVSEPRCTDWNGIDGRNDCGISVSFTPISQQLADLWVCQSLLKRRLVRTGTPENGLIEHFS